MKLLYCEIKFWVSVTKTKLYLPVIFISSGAGAVLQVSMVSHENGLQIMSDLKGPSFHLSC